jgi:uncharacterized YccA/Bax inhibitor family protein
VCVRISEKIPKPGTGAAALLAALLWGVGIALLFAASFVRARVSLSDDLDAISVLAPIWIFLQVCVLTGVLAGLGRLPAMQVRRSRVIAAVSSAVVVLFLDPQIWSLFIPGDRPLSQQPVLLAQIWSIPLAFYLPAALIVVACWLPRPRRISYGIALGLALIAIGLANLPFTLWLGHLWRLYYEHQSGTVLLLLAERIRL